MNDFKVENGNFEGFTNRAGLYCVWVPLHDDGKAPLVSVWIDPKATAFESQVLEEPVTPSGADDHVPQEIENSRSDLWAACAWSAMERWQTRF